MEVTDPPAVTLIENPETVLALSAVRRRVLAALDTPASASGVADRLGLTRQKVNYHMRALEDAGLVHLHEERPRRGMTERVMQRSQDLVLIEPTAFAEVDLPVGDVIGLTGVISSATDVIRLAAKVAHAASASDSRVASAALNADVRLRDPAALRELIDDVAAVIAKHDAPDGLSFRISTSVLPTLV